MAGVHKQCVTRLQKEYKSLLKDPVPNITAHPSPSNLLEWHFVLEGTKGTEYEGGLYHGKLVFPSEYPFKPPSISLFTPNGRFATNTKLCLSMTDYHPESWNPMWSVGTILTGLLSFMYDTQATTGSITTSKQDKERMAAESLAFNCKNPTFRKLFPNWVEDHARRQATAAQPPAASPAPPPAVPPAANGRAPAVDGADAAPGAQRPDAANGVGIGREEAGRRGAAPQQQGPFGNAVVTLALMVAVFAAVWVSTGGGEVMRSLGAGRASS